MEICRWGECDGWLYTPKGVWCKGCLPLEMHWCWVCHHYSSALLKLAALEVRGLKGNIP